MRTAALLFFLAVSGCVSHAGPYVTNISSDGRGGINVEKCTARYEPWGGTVSNDQCTSSNIRLGQEPGAATR